MQGAALVRDSCPVSPLVMPSIWPWGILLHCLLVQLRLGFLVDLFVRLLFLRGNNMFAQFSGVQNTTDEGCGVRVSIDLCFLKVNKDAHREPQRHAQTDQRWGRPRRRASSMPLLREWNGGNAYRMLIEVDKRLSPAECVGGKRPALLGCSSKNARFIYHRH
jgi:hypothetical protein